MPDLMYPFRFLVAAALAGTHWLITAFGLDPDSGLTWVLSIVGLVVIIRTLLLPITVHSVKQARASGNARPALNALREKYKDAKDIEEFKKMREEQMAIQAEHGVSRLGCLPVLLQMPVFFALYQVLLRAANNQPLGAMNDALVASMGQATVMGVRLGERLGALGNLLANPGHFGLVIVLAVTSAVLGYVTQKRYVLRNMVLDGMPPEFVKTQEIMPIMTAGMMLFAAVAVPVGLLFYWVSSNAYTLVQQAVVTRWFPTPGSRAHDEWMVRNGITPPEEEPAPKPTQE